MTVHWVDEDSGPGTKVLGALDWLRRNVGIMRDDDVLMVLDDDHVYRPEALGDLLQQQLARGPGAAASFFAYFFRGLLVPQGADIVALQLAGGLAEGLPAFHRDFVAGDPACFLVDDLWVAMYLWVTGRQVVSLRDMVTSQGLETVYTRTDNAAVCALMDLQGDQRRDRAMLAAFDGLLGRLAASEPGRLLRHGGPAAKERLARLQGEVSVAERRIAEIDRWLVQAKAAGMAPSALERAAAESVRLKHLYLMQVPASAAA